MRESEQRPTKLSLYYGKSSRDPKSKSSKTVDLPFEQSIIGAVYKSCLKSKVSYRQTLYTPIVVVGHGIPSA